MKIKIGQQAPDFSLNSHLDKNIALSDLRGKNVVLVFYPLAWTPIWTSQIPSYEADEARFTGLNAQVLGISVDHVPCLKAWAESLGGINYPLLSDFWPHGAISEKYGVLRSEGFTERAIFVIDKNGVVRYIDIHDIDKQPSNDELLRILREIDPQLAKTNQNESIPEAMPGLPVGDIVLYCTSWCPDCRRARNWLKANNLDFEEVDIDTNPAASELVKKWNNGKRITPTIDIGGVIIANFDESKLVKALKDRLKGWFFREGCVDKIIKSAQ